MVTASPFVSLLLCLDVAAAFVLEGTPMRSRATIVPSSAARIRLEFTKTSPTQIEAEDLGIRDWPSIARTAAFEEACTEGSLRYVLEGRGFVTSGVNNSVPVTPNSLLRVTTDSSTLSWTLDEGCDELVVLTPEYQGPPIALVAGVFAVLCIGLILASSA